MPVVNLPNGTRLNFPDGMSSEEMASAIDSSFPEYASKPAAGQPTGLLARMAAPQDTPADNMDDGISALMAPAAAPQPKRQSVLEGIQLDAPAGMTADVDSGANRYARDRSRSPNSVMYTKANAEDAAATAVTAGKARIAQRAADRAAPVPDMTAASLGRDVLAGTQKIVPTVAKGFTDIASLMTGGAVGHDASREIDNYMSNISRVIGSDRSKVQQTKFEADMADPNVGIADAILSNKGALSDQILPTIGSMVLPVGAAGVAGKVAGLGRVAESLSAASKLARIGKAEEAAVIVSTVFQNASDTFNTVLDKGGSTADAYLAAGITAPFSAVAGKITGGGAEMALARRLFNGRSAAQGFGREALSTVKAMGLEAAQEGTEQVGQSTGEAFGTGEDLTLNKLGKDVASAAALGGLVGGGGHLAGLHGQAAPVQQSAEDLARSKGFLTPPPAAIVAPRVEDMPTTPVAPTVVTPKANATQNVTQQILAAEGAPVDAVPGVPGAAPTVQPPGADSAGQADGQPAPAVSNAVQPGVPVPAAPGATVQPVSNPASAIPAATDPRQAALAKLEAALAASRARQEAPAPAPAPATETKPSYQPAIPQPGQTEAIIQRALETRPAHADLQNATAYPDDVLARIGGHPGADQGLRDAVTREQNRRQGVIDDVAAATEQQRVATEQQRTENRSGQSAEIPAYRPGARPLSVEGAISLMQQAKGRALLPQERAHLDAVKAEIGDKAFDLIKRHAEMPFRTSMTERKFDLPRIISDNNAAIAAWDKGPTNGTDTATASPSVGSPAPASAPVQSTTQGRVQYSGFGQAGANQSRVPAGAPAVGSNTTTASTGGLALAPTSSIKRFSLVRDGISKQKPGVNVALSQQPLNEEQKVASAFAHAMGSTFSLVEDEGTTGNMPNGFVDGYGGKNVYVDAKSTHAPLIVVAHELLHGLPEHIRAPLIKALNKIATPGAKQEFLKRYGYIRLAASDKAEEVGAYLAQLSAQRPGFWQELRQKMGNKDFSALATHILSKFKEMAGVLRDKTDSEFLDRHFNKGQIAEMRRLVADAYAQSMREQGMKPDETLVNVPLATKPIAVGDYQTVQNKDGSMTVRGNPDEIRALMPDGIQGRVTKDGIAFTHSDAPRVRHALEGNNTAYSRGGQVTEKLALTKDGKYIGAPEKFNTPGKIPHLRKWLMKLTKEGEAGRFWYENSSKAILRMVGGDKVEARKFAALLAIYSPQAKVDTNGTFALRAWAQYKAGQPISVKTGVMDAKAQAALDNVDEFWSGEKTGNFVTNLLRNIDPHLAQGATIDMWMMRAAQYDNDAPTKTQYAFMENETNRIARELGWEPQQVQAAIWVAMKARMENDGVKKAVEAKSEKKGWIHYDYPLKNGKPQKTRVIDDAAQHRGNWLDQALAYDPSTNDTQRAKFDFEDSLSRHIGQVSWEARPGRSTGVLPGVNDAPYDQQVEFQQAVQKALMGPNGEDLLAQQLGLLTDGEDLLAPGVWQGEVAAGMQKSMAMAPAKGDEGKTSLDATQKKNLDIYSAMLGLLLRQEGVGWHRPFYNGKASTENGVEIRIGQAFTPEQAKELWAAVDSRMRAKGVADWEQGAGMISSPEGMRVVNFGALEDNKQFKALVADAITDVSVEAHLKDFTSDGNLVTNDWKADQNGQGFISHIRDSGRSDLLGWSRDVLAPRVQRVFDEFSEKYDWGNPGAIPLSNKSEGRTDDSGDRSGSSTDNGDAPRYGKPIAGAVSATGYHFSKQPRTTLNAQYYGMGTGLKGLEAERLAGAENSDIRPRVFFYISKGSGIRPEDGVGGHGHRVQLDNLYDAGKDSLGVIKGVRGQPGNKSNNWERAVKEAGFDGYLFIDPAMPQGFAVLLGSKHSAVPVEPYSPPGYSAPAAAPQPYKRGLSSKELNAIDIGAVQEAAPSAKLRAGTFQVDESELDAAREVLSGQGISLPAATLPFSNKATDLDQDITLEIPVEGGKVAKLTVNAAVYIKQLDARQSALEMVKECML